MNEAETTTEELRELIRVGHGMLKDLKQAHRETRTLMAECRALIQEAQDAPKVETEKAIRAVTDVAVVSIAKETSAVINDVTAMVEKTVFDRFDVLMQAILGVDDERGSIPDLLAARLGKPQVDLEALRSVASPIVRGKR